MEMQTVIWLDSADRRYLSGASDAWCERFWLSMLFEIAPIVDRNSGFPVIHSIQSQSVTLNDGWSSLTSRCPEAYKSYHIFKPAILLDLLPCYFAATDRSGHAIHVNATRRHATAICNR